MVKLQKALKEKRFDRVRQILNNSTDFKKVLGFVEEDKGFTDTLQPLKIAVLGSYTSRNILDSLKVKLIVSGFMPNIKFGEYNQYTQEIMDPKSFVHEMNPHIIIITLDTNTFFDNLEFKILDMNEDEITELFENKKAYIQGMLKSALSLNSQIILTNLVVPHFSPNGLTDNTKGFQALVRKFNEELNIMASKFDGVTILDFESLASYHGKNNVTDNKLFCLGKIYISNMMAPLFSDEILRIINAMYGKTKKCLVLDLDNTLWGGILGEDGPTGVKLGDDGQGYSFKEAQKVILNYYKNGIILAINSKNNKDDVLELFDKNNNMILKPENFAVIKANWQDKATNIREIAKELNIGLDSLVFVDDNPMERGLIKEALPMVLVPEFPEDPSNLPNMLRSLSCFDSLTLSKEDKKRNKMYAEEKKRNESSTSFGNLSDYLFDLKIKIEIRKNSVDDIERISQLINKTNQFNLATNRYTLEQVREFMTSNKHTVYSMRVWDKFGELGLTGVIITKEEKDYIHISDFLMSCRIMGRSIEQEFLRQVLLDLNKPVKAEFRPTKKNIPVIDFYDNIGFEKIAERDSIKEYMAKDKIAQVKWIEVLDNE